MFGVDAAQISLLEPGLPRYDIKSQLDSFDYLYPKFINQSPWQTADPQGTALLQDDFILIAEFSEQEGPRPVIVIPKDGGQNFDKNEFSVKILAVDHQSSIVEGVESTEDAQVVMSDPDTAAHAFIHHIVLNDIQARGYVRPFCISYLTPDPQKIMKCYEEISSQMKKVARLMKYGNRLVFMRDLEKYQEDLSYTKTQLLISQSRNQGTTQGDSELLNSLNTLRQSMEEVKDIIANLKPLIQFDTELLERFQSYERELKSQPQAPSKEDYDVSSLHDMGWKENGVKEQLSGSYNERTSPEFSLFSKIKDQKPKVLDVSTLRGKRRFDRSLRGLHELCSWGAKEGLQRLRAFREFLKRDLSSIYVDEMDLSALEPEKGVLCFGNHTVGANFLSTSGSIRNACCLNRKMSELTYHHPGMSQLGSVDSFKSLPSSFQSFYDEDPMYSAQSSMVDASSTGFHDSQSGAQAYLRQNSQLSSDYSVPSEKSQEDIESMFQSENFQEPATSSPLSDFKRPLLETFKSVGEVHGKAFDTLKSVGEVQGKMYDTLKSVGEVHGKMLDTLKSVGEVHGKMLDTLKSVGEVHGKVLDTLKSVGEVHGKVLDTSEKDTEVSGKTSGFKQNEATQKVRSSSNSSIVKRDDSLKQSVDAGDTSELKVETDSRQRGGSTNSDFENIEIEKDLKCNARGCKCEVSSVSTAGSKKMFNKIITGGEQAKHGKEVDRGKEFCHNIANKCKDIDHGSSTTDGLEEEEFLTVVTFQTCDSEKDQEIDSSMTQSTGTLCGCNSVITAGVGDIETLTDGAKITSLEETTDEHKPEITKTDFRSEEIDDNVDTTDNLIPHKKSVGNGRKENIDSKDENSIINESFSAKESLNDVGDLDEDFGDHLANTEKVTKYGIKESSLEFDADDEKGNVNNSSSEGMGLKKNSSLDFEKSVCLGAHVQPYTDVETRKRRLKFTHPLRSVGRQDWVCEIGQALQKMFSSYNNLQHIVYSLLSGRPVVIIGNRKHDGSIKDFVQALSVFVPYLPRTGTISLLCPRKQLKVSDVHKFQLLGLIRSDNHSVDYLLPKCIRRYITLVDVEKMMIFCQPYQGTLLSFITGIHNKKKTFKSDSSLLSFIQLCLEEISTKAFCFYHTILPGDGCSLFSGTTLPRKSAMLELSSEKYLNKAGVMNSDCRIVKHLSQIVILQQIDEEFQNKYLTDAPACPFSVNYQAIHTFKL